MWITGIDTFKGMREPAAIYALRETHLLPRQLFRLPVPPHSTLHLRHNEERVELSELVVASDKGQVRQLSVAGNAVSIPGGIRVTIPPFVQLKPLTQEVQRAYEWALDSDRQWPQEVWLGIVFAVVAGIEAVLWWALVRLNRGTHSAVA